MISENIIACDLPEALATFEEFIQQTNSVSASVETLLKRIQNNEYKTEMGNSFLELKYQMLLSYIVNLTYLIHRKVTGKSIEGESTVERLVEIRTVLEKMRPIDQKLKYQIDKLLKSSVAGNINPNDPIHLKPNIGISLNKDYDEDEGESLHSEEEDQMGSVKPKVYVAPKVLPMQYDGDDTLKDKKQKLMDKTRKRILNSSILEELKKEFSQEPDEIWDSAGGHKFKQNKKMKERMEYEEKYMTRIPITKKAKHNNKLSAIMNLGNLAKFDDISALDTDMNDISDIRKTTGKKKFGKKKGKKKGFKKRKR